MISRSSVEFDAECTLETPQALRVLIGENSYWIPKSVISEDSEVQSQNDVGTLVIAEWFAEKEGIE